METLQIVLRAVASLIVVVGLIVWLGKRFNGDGSGSAVARLGGQTKSARKPFASRFSGLGSAFSGRSAKQDNLVTVVGRQVLAGRTSVAVIDVDGQRLVLGVTDTQVSVLHSRELEAPALQADVLPDDRSPSSVRPDSQVAALGKELSAGMEFADVLEDALAEDGVSTTNAAADIVADGLANSSVDDLADSVLVPAKPENKNFSHSRMDGSILSPNTWRQAKAAMKVARVGGKKTTNDHTSWR